MKARVRAARVSLCVCLSGAMIAGSIYPVSGDEKKYDTELRERLAETKECRECDLTDQNLSGLDLSGGDFSGANLAGAWLYRTDLSGANLTNVNVERAWLESAKLAGATLTGANFAGADLTRAHAPSFAGAVTNESTTCPDEKPGPCASTPE